MAILLYKAIAESQGDIQTLQSTIRKIVKASRYSEVIELDPQLFIDLLKKYFDLFQQFLINKDEKAYEALLVQASHFLAKYDLAVDAVEIEGKSFKTFEELLEHLFPEQKMTQCLILGLMGLTVEKDEYNRIKNYWYEGIKRLRQEFPKLAEKLEKMNREDLHTLEHEQDPFMDYFEKGFDDVKTMLSANGFYMPALKVLRTSAYYSPQELLYEAFTQDFSIGGWKRNEIEKLLDKKVLDQKELTRIPKILKGTRIGAGTKIKNGVVINGAGVVIGANVVLDKVQIAGDQVQIKDETHLNEVLFFDDSVIIDENNILSKVIFYGEKEDNPPLRSFTIGKQNQITHMRFLRAYDQSEIKIGSYNVIGSVKRISKIFSKRVGVYIGNRNLLTEPFFMSTYVGESPLLSDDFGAWPQYAEKIIDILKTHKWINEDGFYTGASNDGIYVADFVKALENITLSWQEKEKMFNVFAKKQIEADRNKPVFIGHNLKLDANIDFYGNSLLAVDLSEILKATQNNHLSKYISIQYEQAKTMSPNISFPFIIMKDEKAYDDLIQFFIDHFDELPDEKHSVKTLLQQVRNLKELDFSSALNVEKLMKRFKDVLIPVDYSETTDNSEK
jgi:hypothetical protein